MKRKRIIRLGVCGHYRETYLLSIITGCFGRKYKLYLPTEEELKAEIETQKILFQLQQQEKKEQK